MNSSLRKPPPRGPVALTRIEGEVAAAVARALELCQGFKYLRPSDHVLLKPNLVGVPSAYDVPPFGVLTTTAVIQAMLGLLKDQGVSRVTIADGGLENAQLGMSTMAAMELLGLPALARTHGAKLEDLNHGAWREVDLQGLKLRMAATALEADFVVSLPVLKTHNQCRVSLALKNMKGALRLRSKAACHDRDLNLDRNVALLSRALYPDLALIDGRYALARGPMHTGKAQRADLLIAARDALDADLAGAAVLGQDPARVEHLVEMARLLGREPAAPAVVGGPSIEEARLDLPWDWEWADRDTPLPYQKAGVKGFSLPKYDSSLCTGCSVMYNPMLVMVLMAGQGKDLGGVELLTGKGHQPSGQAAVTALFGNCIIKRCRQDGRIKRPVLIPGCPPSLEQIESGLRQAGIEADLEAYRDFLASLWPRYPESKGFIKADFAPREAS